MIFKACAVALIAAFVAVIVGELGWRGRGVFSAISAALLLSLAADGLSVLVGEIKALAYFTELSEIGVSALKIIGIGYVFGIGSDVCSNLGEKGIATALELVGRLEILLVALPYFKKIFDLGIRLLE